MKMMYIIVMHNYFSLFSHWHQQVLWGMEKYLLNSLYEKLNETKFL